MMDTLVRTVERTIASERLLQPEDSVIVAVSGGPDSTALLHILFLLSESWRLRLTIAHVNHRFRGEESDREERFVRGLGERYELPVAVGVIDVPGYMEETGRGAQDAARVKRYEFLAETARAAGARRIALGHHADDQAETVLLRFLRGAGAGGLRGMAMRRSYENLELIRPLLRIYKREFIAFCERHGLPFCFDSSNAQRKYTRNRVRLDLLPTLLAYNPQLPDALNRLADVMGEEDDFLERETEAVFARLAVRSANEIRLARGGFTALHVALQRRLIKLILSYLAQGGEISDFAGVERIRSAIVSDEATTAAWTVGERLFFVREYDTIRFTRETDESHRFYYTVDAGDGELDLAGTGMAIAYGIASGPAAREELESGNAHVAFDLEQLRFPLTVRSRLPGDRIDAVGLNGSKKVKDIFIDEKVPPRLREAVPIVTDADGRILWVAGWRRSVHAEPTGRTKAYFFMRLIRLHE